MKLPKLYRPEFDVNVSSRARYVFAQFYLLRFRIMRVSLNLSVFDVNKGKTVDVKRSAYWVFPKYKVRLLRSNEDKHEKQRTQETDV